jgi:hypothetical protein
MFSASLLSMMIHSLPPEALGPFVGPPQEGPGEPPGPPTSIPDANDLARRFKLALSSWSGPWALIPVVARADPKNFEQLQTLAKQSDGHEDPARSFIWGRIPLDLLIQHFLAAGTAAIEQEHLDLGTPVRAASGATASTCGTLLAQTPTRGSATVGAAVVDLGDTPTTATGVPRDFNRKLRHVQYSATVDLSAHAESVLEVLLDRLNRISAPGNTSANMLSITTVSMALVLNPTPNQIRASKGCFGQHCAPEMLTAVQAIDALLDGDKLPAVVNMSLGTHVGPHNGHSPLEQYISGTLFRPSDRFLFAAAGNEGGKGIASRLDLRKGEADYMDLIVDERCTELLVEFWWDDVGPADVAIGAEIEGGRFTPSRVVIGPGVKGLTSVLAPASMGQRPSVSFLTLLESRAHGTMSCIAFAASRASAAPEFRVSFDLTAKSADATVHAWIVICDAAMKTHFTQGGPEGTVAAPASDPKVVSVAGFDRALGQMWRHSSRGPASRYSTASQTQSPVMAHLVEHLGTGPATPGTSLASPRAAADAAQPLADPTRRTSCTEADKLLQITYGTITAWDPRYGLRKQTV